MAAMRHFEGAKQLGRAALLGKIKYVILHVNSVCTAKCRMCFTWDGMMERWDAKGHSLEDLEKLARSMNPLPQLTFSGGEPLLRKDMPQIVQTFYEQGGTRFFTIPTNSLKPDRVERMIQHFIEHCPKAFLNFCLPFHGTEEHFDDIMGVPGNYQKFRQTWEVVRKYRESHPNISCVLNFVMSKFNYTEYKNIIDLHEREYQDTPIGIAYCRGTTHERDATNVPVETYLEAQRYLGERRRNHTRYNPYTIMFDTVGEQLQVVIADVVRGERQDINCGAGKNFLVVYDNGAVFPCELLETVGMPKAKDGETPPTHESLGNLYDFGYDMNALLHSEHAEKLIKWIETHDCACTWECAIYSTLLHNNKDRMQLAKNAVRYLAKPGVKAKPDPAEAASV